MVTQKSNKVRREQPISGLGDVILQVDSALGLGPKGAENFIRTLVRDKLSAVAQSTHNANFGSSREGMAAN